jgi:hypothetical protein
MTWRVGHEERLDRSGGPEFHAFCQGVEYSRRQHRRCGSKEGRRHVTCRHDEDVMEDAVRATLVTLGRGRLPVELSEKGPKNGSAEYCLSRKVPARSVLQDGGF